MASALDGDRRAFESLVRRHQRPLVNHLYRQIGRREIALDLAQEVFLKVYLSLSSFDPSYRFTTWLYHIARNVARDELRTRQRRPQFCSSEHGMDRAETGQQELSEQLARKELVLRALERLSERDRNLVVLRDVESRSYEEIAKLLEMQLGTVKSGLSRARQRFAQHFAAVS